MFFKPLQSPGCRGEELRRDRFRNDVGVRFDRCSVSKLNGDLVPLVKSVFIRIESLNRAFRQVEENFAGDAVVLFAGRDNSREISALNAEDPVAGDRSLFSTDIIDPGDGLPNFGNEERAVDEKIHGENGMREFLDFFRKILHSHQVRLISIKFCYGLLLLSFVGSLSSCRTLGQKKKDKKARTSMAERVGSMQIPIGTVHLVNEAGRFVLIRSSRALKIEPGTMIDIMGPGGAPVASAQVSPARRGQFLTADILSGVPVTGNQVLMNYTAKEPDVPGTPGEAPGSDIQVLD